MQVQGCEKLLHVSLFLMNRLNKPTSMILLFDRFPIFLKDQFVVFCLFVVVYVFVFVVVLVLVSNYFMTD